jgi:TolA-binding protein
MNVSSYLMLFSHHWQSQIDQLHQEIAAHTHDVQLLQKQTDEVQKQHESLSEYIKVSCSLHSFIFICEKKSTKAIMPHAFAASAADDCFPKAFKKMSALDSRSHAIQV